MLSLLVHDHHAVCVIRARNGSRDQKHSGSDDDGSEGSRDAFSPSSTSIGSVAMTK